MVIFLNKKMKRGNSVHKKPHDDPNSTIININLPQPKMRVKFPKLLMKPMQRRNHRCTDHESNVDRKKASKNGDFLHKRIGFIILNACGSKKAQDMSSSSNQQVETENADDSNLKNNNIQDSFSEQEITFDHEVLEDKESAGLEEKVDKKTMKMPTKISRFIRNRIGFPFRKLKLVEQSNGGASEKNSSQNHDERKRVAKKLIIRDVEEEEEEEEERSEMELCKKRILMGEKCRPLNLSGALHYDIDGVLLPEEVL